MSKNHFNPKLNKVRLFDHQDFTVYSVNGFAVRNVAQPDEEFGNFAMHDGFPHLIPKDELWISEKVAAKEGIFFIANALTRLARKANGAAEKAYDDGLEVERILREKVNGITFRDGKPHKQVPDCIYLKPYLTLADPLGTVTVWLVDGNVVRSYYKTDYIEGGHGYVYSWVPRPEIWIEDGVDHREIPFILAHEYLERRLMRDARLGYDHAHTIASKLEFDLRKGRGITPLLTRAGKPLGKSDLPGLVKEDVYSAVLRRYLHRQS